MGFVGGVGGPPPQNRMNRRDFQMILLGGFVTIVCGVVVAVIVKFLF